MQHCMPRLPHNLLLCRLLLVLQLIAKAGAVLLQREIPEAANIQVAKVSKSNKAAAALKHLVL
jgi:hypothetical protein